MSNVDPNLQKPIVYRDVNSGDSASSAPPAYAQTAAAPRPPLFSDDSQQRQQKQQQQQQQHQHPSQQLAPPVGSGYEEKEISVPVTFAWNPDSQSTPEVSVLQEPFKTLFGPDANEQLVVQSVHVMHTDNTVPSPMTLHLHGVQGEEKHLIGGVNTEGHAHTFIVPRGSHTYGPDGNPIYTRSIKELSDTDFSENIGVDVDELSAPLPPYYGKGGKFAKTHVEVHANANPSLYKMIDQSNLSTKFLSGTSDNPSIALSKVERDKMVAAYKKGGGYARTSRTKASAIKSSLMHLGSQANNDASSALRNLPGLSPSERTSALSTPHRVLVVMRFRIAKSTTN